MRLRQVGVASASQVARGVLDSSEVCSNVATLPLDHTTIPTVVELNVVSQGSRISLYPAFGGLSEGNVIFLNVPPFFDGGMPRAMSQSGRMHTRSTQR